MKKFILVTNAEMADMLEEMGFSSLGTRTLGNGVEAVQFLYDDKMHSILKDRKTFSRKYYCVSDRLTF